MHGSPNPSISFIGGGKHCAKQGENFPPHRHPYWEIVYYSAGNITAPIGSKLYKTSPGMVLLTPPGTTHAEIADTAYSNYYVVVDTPIDCGWPDVVFDSESLNLRRLFEGLTKELNGRRDHSEMLLAGYALELDVLIRRAAEYDSATNAERIVLRAEMTIEERFGAKVKIGEIASELHCSPSSLRSHFAELRSTTPRAYLQSVRLRHALGLLRGSDATIETIAQLCGYDSASHLSRHVKSETGFSPGRLRRSALDSTATVRSSNQFR